MDITKHKLNSKLTLLRAGATNFRSVGKEEHIVNFADSSNTLVSSDTNGVAKSTLFLYLPYYCITGESYKSSDTVDSLINSGSGKNMLCFLEWNFAGTYYKLERGRKPSLLEIYKLIDEEWIVIPDLPVSSRDRQGVVYTLMGIPAKTAKTTIENSILLGVSKFSGFTQMETSKRRDLIETVLDLGVFTALNNKTKDLRKTIISEQKQTLAEITQYDLKHALSSQAVGYSIQEINTLKTTHNAQGEVLNSKVSDCTTKLEETLALDTDGAELHCAFEESSEDIARRKVSLDKKLEHDVSNLGEFVIDENDKVLVKLGTDLLSVDYGISVAKKKLKEKEDSVSDEITTEVKTLKVLMSERKVRYNADKTTIEGNNTTAVAANEVALKIAKSELTSLQEKLVKAKEYATECKEVYKKTSDTYEDALAKEIKYNTNISKLKDALVFVSNKAAIEESNLNGLVHIGVCEKCKQMVTKEYIEASRKDLEGKLSVLQEEVSVYESRIKKGEESVLNLNLATLKEKVNLTGQAAATAESVCNNIGLLQQEVLVDKLVTEQANITRNYVQEKQDLMLQFDNDVLILQNKLDSVGHETAKVLGSYQAKVNQLLESAPSQKTNLLQQIEDRKIAMRGEHAGTETHLKSLYNATQEALKTELSNHTTALERGLQSLIDFKEREVSVAESSLLEARAAVENEEKTYIEKLKHSEVKLKECKKELEELSGKLKELNTLHDKQQHDIEDYDVLLKVLSDQHGKAAVVDYFLPQINRDINRFLNHMNLPINLKMDNVFKLEMDCLDRKGQTIASLSAGEECKINIAVMLALREVAQSNNSVNCNLLVLDEVLENLHPTAVVDCVDMLKDLFSELNLVVITQRGDEFGELFAAHKRYTKVGSITKELQND